LRTAQPITGHAFSPNSKEHKPLRPAQGSAAPLLLDFRGPTYGAGPPNWSSGLQTPRPPQFSTPGMGRGGSRCRV